MHMDLCILGILDPVDSLRVLMIDFKKGMGSVKLY